MGEAKMTKHNVHERNGHYVGYTTSHAELQSFLKAYPGATVISLEEADVNPPSTLPSLRDCPPAHTGEFLRQ